VLLERAKASEVFSDTNMISFPADPAEFVPKVSMDELLDIMSGVALMAFSAEFLNPSGHQFHALLWTAISSGGRCYYGMPVWSQGSVSTNKSASPG
jgi:hypothetical protein